jgi:hypothetical protein
MLIAERLRSRYAARTAAGAHACPPETPWFAARVQPRRASAAVTSFVSRQPRVRRPARHLCSAANVAIQRVARCARSAQRGLAPDRGEHAARVITKAGTRSDAISRHEASELAGTAVCDTRRSLTISARRPAMVFVCKSACTEQDTDTLSVTHTICDLPDQMDGNRRVCTSNRGSEAPESEPSHTSARFSHGRRVVWRRQVQQTSDTEARECRYRCKIRTIR